jgi:creatinine amidohydrolase
MRHLSPEGVVSFSWLAADLNRSGVAGDARLADAEKGKCLVAHYGEALADVIRDARAFPLERLI